VSKRIAALFAALMVMLAAVGVAPSPAQASWNACQSGYFCMWENTNYWGSFDPRSVPYDSCLISPQWISSIRNHRSDIVLIYTTSLCTGTGFPVQPGQSFSPMPGQIGDNAMRSFKMLT
jgi:Peptidase inhibitor family I36